MGLLTIFLSIKFFNCFNFIFVLMGRLLLYGFHFFLAACLLYAIAVLEILLAVLGMAFSSWQIQLFFNIAVFLFTIAFLAFAIETIFFSVFFKQPRVLRFDPLKSFKISVGITAYNDEGVIGKAVEDFKKAENVEKVIVIDNNCIDGTAKEAASAGAIVVKEEVQGYGAACIKALSEAKKYGNIACLVEGDQTFSSTDLKKLTAYIENCDMVVGTRTTAEIVSPDSQVDFFMHYGNLFIAKLVQLRYWGKIRLTDVGCTFRIIRPEALEKILPKLNVCGNHFSPHMILIALENNLKIIEVPVSLKKRGGQSKGVGSNKIKGLVNGFKMWQMILTH